MCSCSTFCCRARLLWNRKNSGFIYARYIATNQPVQQIGSECRILRRISSSTRKYPLISNKSMIEGNLAPRISTFALDEWMSLKSGVRRLCSQYDGKPTDKVSSNKLDAVKNDPEMREILEDIQNDFDENVESTHQVDIRDKASSSEALKGDENVPRALQRKFTVFRDEDAEIIKDMHEEELENQHTQPSKVARRSVELLQKIEGLDLTRAKTGVFDIEELISLLREENARDICCIRFPVEMRYADYLVIASGRSTRHLKAMAEFIRKVYKMKKHEKDKFFVIEGLDTKNWLALDLGNIVLHLFLPEIRDIYNLETLWTVGEKYDDLTQRAEEDEVVKALQANTRFLSDIEPLSKQPNQGLAHN